MTEPDYLPALGGAAPSDVTLQAARGWLADRLADGEHCPCCGQLAKVYARQINAQMAHVLIRMYRQTVETGEVWVHLPSLYRMGGDTGKLAHWNLIEESVEVRADGGRAGWWRVTPDGVDFVRGLLTVPRYALIYDGRLLGFDGPSWSIRDALGKRFDYTELMSA